ncbi:ArsA family ATPase [Patescibacteria group bacterium]|nr:ArsA family ATPase [Patescibacteria group bacterium]
MALNGLLEKPLQFIIFGGKGGVGKTTMSAALALKFAEAHKDKKILIFTTDPAPSLGDSFEQELSNKPAKINGTQNLWAMEINAKVVLEEFKEKYGKDILDILQQGTYLEDEETKEILSLDIPGLDEIMGLKKITDFMESQEYDLYIVDTAPTGHTLRLLTLPDLLDNWIKFLAGLRWKYHYIIERASGRKRIESADKFLLEMKKTVKKVKSLLQDPIKTEFVVVTIAEAMGVAETEDLISSLEKSRIPSHYIIINNIFPKDGSEFAEARRENQDKYISKMKKKFSGYIITEVILQPTEIRGVGALKSLAKKIF